MLDTAAVSPGAARPVERRLHAWRFVRTRALVLAVAAAAAFLARAGALDASGLAEDEMDKLQAAERYRQGDFAFDGEHPALMKFAVLASTRAAAVWNRHAPGAASVSVEAAVRLPNVIAGTLVALLLFLLVEHWFSPLAAFMAAWLWSFDVNAIAVNRIAKEDTFALMFLLLGALVYERAKAVGARDPAGAQRWFTAAGACFGLLLASKYLPYLVGIHILFFRLAEPHPGRNRADKGRYFGAMGLAFLAANFPVVLPGNWDTLAGFLTERAVRHTGYLFQGQVWLNTLSATPGGLPWRFYAVDLATKVPLAVLAAALSGLWLLARRRTRGAWFVLVFTALTFVPYSLAATKFLRYMLPTLAMLDIAAAVAMAALVAGAARRAAAIRTAAALGVAATLAAPVSAWLGTRTHPSLYRNAVGMRLAPQALWFPPDELYDAGVREALAGLAAVAPPRATILAEAPAVARYYAAAYGRGDLHVERLTGRTPRAGDWVLVQAGRLYFENAPAIGRLRHEPPAFVIDVGGFRAVEVYRLAHTRAPA